MPQNWHHYSPWFFACCAARAAATWKPRIDHSSTQAPVDSPYPARPLPRPQLHPQGPYQLSATIFWTHARCQASCRQQVLPPFCTALPVCALYLCWPLWPTFGASSKTNVGRLRLLNCCPKLLLSPPSTAWCVVMTFCWQHCWLLCTGGLCSVWAAAKSSMAL